MNTDTSHALFTRALELLPGGVNSPVRAFRSVGGEPFFAKRAEGAYLIDVDGNRYVDYVGSWGPMIAGHAHPDVLDAVARTMCDGLSFGVPKVLADLTLTLPYNDFDAATRLFDEAGDDIAGVIVEPIVGNANCILPRDGYLQHLRDLCTRHGAILIFDEVMTGFRVALGGAQQRYGIEPDLSTFGKIIGGGMPVGAYGGRADLMRQVAPAGPVYQAGTLSGNPVAMAAGLATLRLIEAPGFHERLERRTHELCDGLETAARDAGVALTTNRSCAMFGLFFTDRKVETFADAIACDTAAFNRFFHAMLRRGVYFAPSAFEAAFLSSAHGDVEIAHTMEAAREAFREVASA